MLRATEEMAALGESLVDLAEILDAAGSREEAVAAAREGRDILAAKGVRPLVRRADGSRVGPLGTAQLTSTPPISSRRS